MNANPPLKQWAGRRAWIIGASSGIGRATASALHAQGAEVTVSARDQVALNTFVNLHPGAKALAFDATDEAGTKAATQAILDAGPVHLVMYCAGHFRPMDTLDMLPDEITRHWQVNYMGAIRVIAGMLPTLRRQAQAGEASHISLVGSVAGYSGLPQSLAYGPTKAALINLAETMYVDLLDCGVAVSLVNPGFVASPLTAQNTFWMPALITPEVAAAEILRGWRRGEFEIHFPKRFTYWTKLLRLLPYSAAFAIKRRLLRHPSHRGSQT